MGGRKNTNDKKSFLPIYHTFAKNKSGEQS